MSEVNALTQLVTVTEAAYQDAQQRFQVIAQQEQKLRNALAQLDEILRKSFDPDIEAIPLRAIGADVAWQKEIGRSKQLLNLQLARVLAQKEPHIAKVRLAFGKYQVALSILKTATTKDRKTRAKQFQDRAIEHALFRP